jgi:pantoate kinase
LNPFEELIEEGRKFAKKEGLKKSDVRKAIKKVHSERRH